MSEQLRSKLSHSEQSLSSPSPKRLRAWRLYLESSLALIDVLDAELQRDAGISQRWYDVLIHTSETANGLRMNELADRILYSKSGLTRVIDRMEDAGFVRRIRREDDRRSILVVLTDDGRAKLEQARRHHRHHLEQHFSRLLADIDIEALTRAFEKISAHVRPLRPGSVR